MAFLSDLIAHVPCQRLTFAKQPDVVDLHSGPDNQDSAGGFMMKLNADTFLGLLSTNAAASPPT